MRILVFTHMYPSERHPESGVFVQQQVESLRRTGITVDLLHVDTKRSRWLYPWSVAPLLRQALSREYDLVHAHYVFAGVVARSQFRHPLVVTHHGDEAFHGWQAPLCRLVSRYASRTIAVTEQIKRAVGRADAIVIPCGVDFELFRPLPQSWAREQLGLPAKKPLVLYVGDYRKPLKRFDLVQEAVGRLKAGGLDADLVLAYKQPYGSVPVYMNACDVLLLPSEREGSPQVVKEAMACNLPVISAAVGDVSEVLAGIDGCHICRREAGDVAEKLRWVLESRQRTHGREASRRFELGAIAGRIAKVYESVVAVRRG